MGWRLSITMLMQRKKFVPKRFADYWLITPEERELINKQIEDFYTGQVSRYKRFPDAIKNDKRFQGNRFFLFPTELSKNGVMRVSFLDFYFGSDDPSIDTNKPPITLQLIKQSRFWLIAHDEEKKRILKYFPNGNEEYYS